MNQDLEKLLDKKGMFLKALDDLSRFRSIMAYSKDPELQELQQTFDQGFTVLRDQFQRAMDEKVNNMYNTASKTSRLRKK